jgi:hypothetical protein
MADALTNDLFANSVTKNDMPEYQGNGVVNFMIPWFMLSQANLALPSELPPYWSLRFGVAAYWSRDLVLRSTILHESFWAGAVSKAATKAAAKSFDLTGPRSGRYQEMLLDWGGDGYVPSQQRGMIDYLCSNNGEFWEIVRVSSAAGSRIIGLVHLDSLRVIRTGDPETPFLFVDLRGIYHELKYYQAFDLVDMPDPAAASLGIGHCAAERAYDYIYNMAGMSQYFKEKITGTGATSLDLVTGLSSPQLQDLFVTGSAEAKSKGFRRFQGRIIGGILANVDVKHITIPLRELPDGYDREKELMIAQLSYANAIGCDPQDINPVLMARGALGVGAQAVVLSEKAAGFGVAARDKHMTHIINKYLLPDSVTFAFKERDLREEKQQADIALVREQTRASMIAAGEVTAEQARQMAVDSDDMPREFIAVDQTQAGAALNDEEKPVTEEQVQAQAVTDMTQTPPTPPQAGPTAPPAASQKEIDALLELKQSIDEARAELKDTEAKQERRSLLDILKHAVTRKEALPSALAPIIFAPTISTPPVTVHMPETKGAPIIVQPAQNNITVQPAPVTVQNAGDVTVQPAPVVIEKNKTVVMKVQRDQKDKMIGATAEVN